MKPLEMSSSAEVWRSTLSILEGSLRRHGDDLQIWFPWGRTWRGHDRKGMLPPTDLPDHLPQTKGARFGGRLWTCHPVGHVTWLLSVKPAPRTAEGQTAPSGDAPPPAQNDLAAWAPTPAETEALTMLAGFLRLESLLGLAVKVLENRASERTGHWDRVRHLADAVGRQMGLSPTERADLELTALLHDLGKVALPGGLLEETRPLTPAERKQIESHSLVGAAMIREIPGMERVAGFVQSHHEAPDGSGYPRGLSGPDIPLISLIVGAVDAFDAMTHERPYATERTYKESIREMINQTGKFDDRVLWALQDVLRRLGILDTHPMVHPPPEPPAAVPAEHSSPPRPPIFSRR